MAAIMRHKPKAPHGVGPKLATRPADQALHMTGASHAKRKENMG
jgi:hypothetical protein